ncbi:798_t:CDS:2 [Acaulospora morrowiae]|uniref:798_t:CDS:1 n=1 Tax=Acaulospora morrowiae TaxID=94023 RepID=A0A9N8ZJP1_9GLOM|nr:798_t:CDS:2 [Acaulospora morrowiae]
MRCMKVVWKTADIPLINNKGGFIYAADFVDIFRVGSFPVNILGNILGIFLFVLKEAKRVIIKDSQEIRL